MAGMMNPWLTMDDVYPVGSIYMSVNATDPGKMFGGTWQRIKERFMLGCGDTHTAGTTGGEFSHTLTFNELPERTIINNSTTKAVNINFCKWEYGTKNAGDFVTSTIRDLAETGAISSLKPYSQPHNITPLPCGLYLEKNRVNAAKAGWRHE